MYSEKQRSAFARGLLIAYWITLFGLTHIPGSTLTRLQLSQNDLAAHFGAYLILTVLYLRALTAGYDALWTYAVRTFPILLGYAVVDELTQMGIPGRFADLSDVVADGCGIMVGLVAMRVIHQWFGVGGRYCDKSID